MRVSETLIAGGLSALALCVMAPAANATEGYFQSGYSAVQQALAGSGVANPEDAMTLANNPAGLTAVGHEIEGGISLFSPIRQYTVSGGPGFVAPGDVRSGNNDFPIPNFAYSQPIDSVSAWGVAVSANGGLNTSYGSGVVNPACGPGSGVFCGGKAGVSLNQVLISAGYSRDVGNWSFGVAPIVAVQMFYADGLVAFSRASASPGNLTNRGADWSYGGGGRVGAIWHVSKAFRLAFSGTTPILMTKFNRYSGLFADGGSFNIPATITAGAAFDVSTTLTVMADYKRIFYSDIAAVGRSSAFTGQPFGSAGGPGFGWSDVNIISIGAEWRAAPRLTLRAGYEHNTNPIGPADVTLNILAPGVTTDAIAGGGSYRFNAHSSLDLAATYVPQNTVSGIEVTPQGPNPGRTISLSMHQFDLTVGYRYQF